MPALDPDALAHRGLSAARSGDLEGAARLLSQARALVPHWAELDRVLGAVRLGLGDAEGAAAAFDAALVGEPEELEAWLGLSDAVVGGAQGLSDGRLIGLLTHPELDPQRVQHLAGRRLLAVGADALAHHPVLHPWLRRTLAGGAWLRRLPAVRAQWLAALAQGAGPPVAAWVSLAIQAVRTEHIWPVSDQESADLRAVLDGPTAPLQARLAQACVVPLEEAARAELAAFPAAAPLLEVAFDGPARARAMGAGLPLLPGARPPTGPVVAQYEAHPYPRLVYLQRRPARAIAALLPALLPGVSLGDLPAHPRVLIAGCGTGQQLLGACARYQGARLSGLDLSRASLGQAACALGAHGFSDVDLWVGDLREVGAWDARFDLIECGGVLHHLPEPAAGWSALAGLLAPGGLMRVAVYSERGRADVRAARALLAAEGLTPAACATDPQVVDRARARLLALDPTHPAAPVCASVDFAARSGLRDLLLHPIEHRSSPLQVGQAVQQAGLRLLGFEVAPAVRARFVQTQGAQAQADPAAWERFEQDHPSAFRGMIRVWAQRPRVGP